MKIYVASSWRNVHQPEVVESLRAAGHAVYDFRNPRPGDDGFHWSDIDPNWKAWTPEEYRNAIGWHWLARRGYESDFGAMVDADACVLVLPSGRSSHLEAGWMAGAGKRLAILMTEQVEPELMYLMATDICLSEEELIATLEAWGAEDESVESMA